jgi:periplasmic protein TonB
MLYSDSVGKKHAAIVTKVIIAPGGPVVGIRRPVGHLRPPLPGCMMKYDPSLRALMPALAAAALVLAGCKSTPLPPDTSSRVPATVAPATTADGRTDYAAQMVRTSGATNPRAYRADAATHLYGLNQERLWKGRLPPMLYAIGVVDIEIDSRGNVRNINWRRAPKHAPEVIAEIERTVRNAAPFPAPVRMGKVVYTDTWLWHESGRFQLDTLTEGQD